MRDKMFTIVVKKSAVKEIRRLPSRYKERIWDVLKTLSRDPFPSGVTAIQGYDQHYRLRIGPFRIIYHVSKTEVLIVVIRIAHRKDVYRNF